MRGYKFIICLHLIHNIVIFFDYIIDKEVVHINRFVIKGHRAALKEFKARPLERVIVVNKEGRIKCYNFEDWTMAIPLLGKRVDILARQCYRVNSKQLTETMVKNTAIKILKGEL